MTNEQLPNPPSEIEIYTENAIRANLRNLINFNLDKFLEANFEKKLNEKFFNDKFYSIEDISQSYKIFKETDDLETIITTLMFPLICSLKEDYKKCNILNKVLLSKLNFKDTDNNKIRLYLYAESIRVINLINSYNNIKLSFVGINQNLKNKSKKLINHLLNETLFEICGHLFKLIYFLINHCKVNTFEWSQIFNENQGEILQIYKKLKIFEIKK